MSLTRAERRVVLLASTANMLPPFTQSIFTPSMAAVRETFGASNTVVALAISLYALGLAAGQTLSGPLADRWAARRVLVLAMSIYFAGSALAFLAGTMPVFIAARLAQALGAASALVVAPSLITDLVPPARRGRALGIMQSFAFAGFVAGPLVGGLMAPLWGWRAVFPLLMAVSLGILAGSRLLPVYPLPTEPLTWQKVRAIVLTSSTRKGLLLGASQVYTIHGLLTMLPLLLHERLHLPVTWIGLTLTLLNVTAMLGSPMGGRAIDRLGIHITIRRGMGVAVGAALLLGAVALVARGVGSLAGVVPALAGIGMGFSWAYPAQVALMVAWFPEIRGTAVGVYNLGRFGGGALGPVTMGLAADLLGLRWAFLLPPLALVTAHLAGARTVTAPASRPSGVAPGE
ncbi:MAG: MFS transporter [Deltaproteobacteria bacterium]|nr:MFS transporter [Deltaproteobacteria bacterium]